MSIGLAISLLVLFVFAGLVILLIKMKMLPIKSKKLEKFLKWFDRIPKLSHW